MYLLKVELYLKSPRQLHLHQSNSQFFIKSNLDEAAMQLHKKSCSFVSLMLTLLFACLYGEAEQGADFLKHRVITKEHNCIQFCNTQ